MITTVNNVEQPLLTIPNDMFVVIGMSTSKYDPSSSVITTDQTLVITQHKATAPTTMWYSTTRPDPLGGFDFPGGYKSANITRTVFEKQHLTNSEH
jgi:hypothetical protein